MGIGIAVGTAIKIKIMEAVAGNKIVIRTAPDVRTGAITKCPVMKAKEAMQVRWAHRLLNSAKRAIQLVLKTVNIIQPSILTMMIQLDRNYFSQKAQV